MKRSFPRTLWDLIAPARRQGGGSSPAPRAAKETAKADLKIAPGSQANIERLGPPPRRTRAKPMQQRYDRLVREMKAMYGIRVRKWRSSSSGCAWEIEYTDGRRVRLIESPYPKGPMSCAIFLHEVGHHAIGLGRYRPRCLEEFHAWAWSLEMMRAHGFNVTRRVEERMAESLYYAVLKAKRRGLKRLPAELIPFANRPEHLKRRAAS
jgi:hypothetical protein